MATRRGIALHGAGVRADDASHAATRALTAEETAWLLLVPALVIATIAITLFGPSLGELVFTTTTHYTFWLTAAQEQLFPKPTELARFALTVVCALGFALAIPLAAARPLRMPPRPTRVAVTIVQLLLVGGLVLFFVAQGSVEPYDLSDPTYFAPLAIAVALGLAAAGSWALTRPTLLERALRAGTGRRAGIACAVTAVLLTVVWLLPSIVTDENVVYAHPITTGHLQFSFDETMSVLNGRSPLVDMATYGALVPYLVALPLATLHASLAAFSSLMTLLTALALLAVFALLRRLTRTTAAALALYVPFLATSLFIVRGESVERFDFGDYFGMFPIRYGGPYLLAWLTTRNLDGDGPRAPALFAAAGLVVLNNTDFGLPALGATVAALVCARPPRTRAELLSLGGQLAAGLGVALALVTLLTLLRAGTLPHLGRLTEYARLFGIAGFGNLPTPLLGFHLVVLATFVAALATAAVRAVDGAADTSLTGMLAWCGVFGVGTGAYFAYRSHPDTLIASFSIWSLTLALLLIVTVRSARTRGGAVPSPATLALLAGCGLAVCSITQVPLPWQQVARLSRVSHQPMLKWAPAARFVHRLARPGAAVAILTPLGHRIAYEAGVRNVVAYTGMQQMPTVEQLHETIDVLRTEGGELLVLGERWWPEVAPELEAAGFRQLEADARSRYIAWQDRAGGP
jgi:hypothetical protein